MPPRPAPASRPAPAPLVSFRGRVGRRDYLVLQLVSASLLVLAVGLPVLGAVAPGPRAAGAAMLPSPGIFAGALFGMLAAFVASVLIGAGAVTRRARDGALPAVFIGMFYVTNRLLMPVTLGLVGSADQRHLALHLAAIMIVVQVLLLARGSVPDRRSARLA